MNDSDDEIPTHNYWPSVTDLFLTLFVIAIAVVAIVFWALLPTNNVGKAKALVHAVGNDFVKIREPINRLRLVLSLEPIGSSLRPSEVVKALAETCDAATTKIEFLQAQIGDLESQLSRLIGSPDEWKQMQLLLTESTQLKQKIKALEQQLRIMGSDKEAVAKIIQENRDLQRQLHDKPPNIQISEQKKEYRFESGSSLMSDAFISGLTENEFARLADEIVARQQEGRVKVDTLEIIGHTDGVPLSRSGNLDQKLPGFLADGHSSILSLTPGSNNDLGLLRALAVSKQWKGYVESHDQNEVLRKVQIRCYSAGQTILPDAKESPNAVDFQQPNPSARRIEMRLTRLLN